MCNLSTHLKPNLIGDNLQLNASNRYILDWLKPHHQTILQIAQATFPKNIKQIIFKLGCNTQQTYGLSLTEKLNITGIPPRYHTAELSKLFQDHLQQIRQAKLISNYAHSFNRIKQNGTNLLLSGRVGTGKTYLACALINYLAQHNFNCRIERVSRLIRHIQSSYSFNTKENEQQILDNYVNYDLLVIDEIGLQRHSESTLLIRNHSAKLTVF